eukprot:1560631-Pyramimonas_sp.AAC.1
MKVRDAASGLARASRCARAASRSSEKACCSRVNARAKAAVPRSSTKSPAMHKCSRARAEEDNSRFAKCVSPLRSARAIERNAINLASVDC